MRTLTTQETIIVSGSNDQIKAVTALAVGTAAAIYTITTETSSNVVGAWIGVIAGGGMGLDLDAAEVGLVIGGGIGWLVGSHAVAPYILSFVAFATGTMMTAACLFDN